MKLVNHLTIRISAIFILVLLGWSAIYLFLQLNEIHDGIDEGLNNLRQEFIIQANNEPGFMNAMEKYDPLNIIIRKLSIEEALDFEEIYSNPKVYFPSEEEEEEVRMLTTAFFCEQNSQYYELKIFTSTVESEDLIKNMLYLLIALWGCLALTLVFGGKKIIAKTNRPFYKLLERLKNFHLDKSQMIEFPKTSISEYIQLNKSIESLLEDNIKTFNEQKNFIENASHELQTPLAIAIGKMELMMDKGGLGQEQLEEINTILSSLNRMKRLNKNLLLLSKIRNKQFIENSMVNITAIFDEIIDDFSDLITHKKIKLEIKRHGNPILLMNIDLAHILVTNLIKNAIAHNTKGGKIEIIIDSHKVTISNTGIPPMQSTNIFERYIMGTDNAKSSGLGLSIVKSITELYKMNISYLYNDLHTITLTF